MCCNGLKELRRTGVWILHVIDHATRFSSAAIVRAIKKEVIISQLFRIWISIFGTPGKFLANNVGKFANQEFIDFAESFGIIVKTAAAESPWINGLCERHNLVVSDAFQKSLKTRTAVLKLHYHGL